MMILGVGNAFRGDDAAGLEAARRLRLRLPEARVLEREGDLAGVLDDWGREEAVIAIDATHSRAPAGTVTRFEAHERPIPAVFSKGSTHLFGLAEAIELGRALGRLPKRVVVYGIEGRDFGAGAALTREVDVAVDRVVRQVQEEVEARA